MCIYISSFAWFFIKFHQHSHYCINSAAGNWTRVSRVTGGNTDHYTTADLPQVRTCISQMHNALPLFQTKQFDNWDRIPQICVPFNVDFDFVVHVSRVVSTLNESALLRFCLCFWCVLYLSMLANQNSRSDSSLILAHILSLKGSPMTRTAAFLLVFLLCFVFEDVSEPE